MLFMVEKSTNFPPEMSDQEVKELFQREREYGREWAEKGKCPHLWRVVGPRLANVAIYDMESAEELNDFLTGLPMRPWMDVKVTLLADHPSRSSTTG